MGSVSEDAKKVLEGAIDLIADESAWCPKGPGSARHYYDDGQTRCALVALAHAAARAEWEDGVAAAYWAARNAVYAVMPPTDSALGKNLGQWNDEPGRTHAEVLALLRTAMEVP